MGDLISRKALVSELENTPIRLAVEKSKMFRLIEKAPTVDAVEVVRCKDCKWYKEGRILKENKFCFRLKHPKEDRRIGYNFSPDDYCSYGEKKEK